MLDCLLTIFVNRKYDDTVLYQNIWKDRRKFNTSMLRDGIKTLVCTINDPEKMIHLNELNTCKILHLNAINA